IPLPRRIDHLLVDQHGVDHAAHLDQLLPVAAVASKARDFTGRYRADLAEADLGHHPLEPDARHTARSPTGRDRRPPCRLRTSRAPLVDPAWHTAAPGSRGCAEPGGSKTAENRGSLCVPDGAA